MKTLAAILEKINHPLVLQELEIPILKPGQVLVEVHFSGICHTQLNEIQGLKGEDKFLPHTLGHEGSGIVLEIGPNVTKVKPGDQVIMSWIKSSGIDVPSTQYVGKNGVVNSGAISTFLTHAIVSENRLVPFTKLPMDIASLLGCAIPTGMGMVFNQLKPKAGSSLAIWGVGGIGSMALIAAASLKCMPLIAIDIHPTKLEMAKHLGATHTLLGNEHPIQQILEITQGKGVDFAIEAAGLIKTMESAYASIRKSGGKLIIAGNPPLGQKISIDPFDLICGKEIMGSWGGGGEFESDIQTYIKNYKNKSLSLAKLQNQQFNFEEINNAIQEIVLGKNTRIVLNYKYEQTCNNHFDI